MGGRRGANVTVVGVRRAPIAGDGTPWVRRADPGSGVVGGGIGPARAAAFFIFIILRIEAPWAFCNEGRELLIEK